MKARIFTLAISFNVLFIPNASAGEIYVDAAVGSKWVATCDRCAQDGNSVLITIKPQDIIVFRQKDTSTSHGVRPKNQDEGAKIKKMLEDAGATVEVK